MSPETLAHVVNAFTTHALEDANRAFLANPSTESWRACLRAMLIHQQARQLSPLDLQAAVANLSPRSWGEGIVQRACCLPIDEVLEKF